MWNDILIAVAWSIGGIVIRLAVILFKHVYPKITIKKQGNVRQTNKKAA